MKVTIHHPIPEFRFRHEALSLGSSFSGFKLQGDFVWPSSVDISRYAAVNKSACC